MTTEAAPSTRRSDATRQALLRAARDEFAQYGLAGARVDRIAEAAGVNKERIYGLFGSKDKLFDVILIETIDEFMEMVNPLAETDPGEYVAKHFDYHSKHPQLMRLMLWEALHRGDDEAHDIDGKRARHYQQKFASASKQFGVDPRNGGLLLLALCGLSNWNLAIPQVVRLLLGPSAADDKAATREFMKEFARAAMRDPALFTPAKGGDSPNSPEPEPDSAADSAPVNDMTSAVDSAAERLRLAQAAADAARDELAAALRAANAAGASANQLARRVSGTLSRPVVLKLLAE
ncbi:MULTISPECIES: TetR/AcrR family transcriptional regulator [unclassified Nocardia]|uniref:TetR/AcrR family transcriptional regulator n=1 Tax=unclassified Nocardia TaxID=2637762 RepID=UPI001CE3EB44|nr:MULTISPECIES: TetR/AcrR family transcriptional regulator [unclassified Nocardia]